MDESFYLKHIDTGDGMTIFSKIADFFGGFPLTTPSNEPQHSAGAGEDNSGSDVMRDWEVYQQGAAGAAFDQRRQFDPD